jgi:hypothetical protein
MILFLLLAIEYSECCGLHIPSTSGYGFANEYQSQGCGLPARAPLHAHSLFPKPECHQETYMTAGHIQVQSSQTMPIVAPTGSIAAATQPGC